MFKVIPRTPRAHATHSHAPHTQVPHLFLPPGRTRTGALRRLVFAATAGVSLAAASFSAAPSAAYADAGTQTRPLSPFAPLLSPLGLAPLGRASDHLTVTVHGTGGRGDGRFELACHPGGGSHPDVEEACGSLDRGTRWGKDPFAPVPPDSVCTMMYGGPATAHVTGTWAGRPVDATFDRSNGCQMARWDRLVPLLPDLR
ncbi:SSI family serine proteinase inhibitor [Streptomyces sp. WI04-05B]|uniref:SSI family serine proteinase inhibitor n=1 Tax=Streptomyces TaxID=1883 RepID=UPI0029A9DD43|nr:MULTISPECIES: SSI family serine proteinase inhibitor [unclassified Streptomyces]MDX2542860.1 SSI family serine proteinase inhibitor [Streptomyces sp. WI04-05B]MDX2588404.1 SSI family serine proteinase inhibitor [Streptomyces sp. WI04-05A]MDX3747301.1 SSI family serine proteinase inhibitor [Streptomyces sp. AK08-02]